MENSSKNKKNIFIKICKHWVKNFKKRNAVNKSAFFLGWLSVLLAAVTLGLLIKINILPFRYMALIVVFMTAFSVLVLKTAKSKTKKGYITSLVLSTLLSCIYLILMIVYIVPFIQKIGNVSDVHKETVVMYVYVRTEDDYSSISELKDKTFAYTTQNTTYSTDTIKLIEEDVGESISVKTYDSFMEMAYGLLNGDVDAIILNSAYAPFLEASEIDPILESYEEARLSMSEAAAVEESESGDETETGETTEESTEETREGADDSVTETLTEEEINAYIAIYELLLNFEDEATILAQYELEYEIAGYIEDSVIDIDQYTTVASEEETNASQGGSSYTVDANPYADTVNSYAGSYDPVSDVTNEPFIIYISGIDKYGKATTVSRSDVNIIVAVNPQTSHILLVTTPRDAYVTHPASNGTKDKLTHAGIYGIANSIGALENLYGINVNYYFKLNFSGFIYMINALGGIDIYSDYTFTCRNTTVSFTQGWNYDVDGYSALRFVRERYAFASGDYQRAKNQMSVIKSVFNKLISPAIITNYSAVLDSVEGLFITSFTFSEITQLVQMQLNYNSEWTIDTYSVTGTGGWAETYSMPGVKLWVNELSSASVATATGLIESVLAETGEVRTTPSDETDTETETDTDTDTDTETDTEDTTEDETTDDTTAQDESSSTETTTESEQSTTTINP